MEGFPSYNERELFNVNGLTPSLEKLINFRIPDLKDYSYQLYAQENLPVSSVKQVELISLRGVEIELFAWLVGLIAECLLYIGIFRTLNDFMFNNGALPSICHFWLNLIACMILYLSVVLLIVCMVQVHGFDV